MRNDINGAPIFSAHLPVQVVERSSGKVVFETEFTDIHLNAAGVAHGGVVATLLDMAVTGGGAASVNHGVGMYGVTMSLTINFIHPIGPGRVRCEGYVTGGGARTKFVDARLFDADGALVATATATVRVVTLAREKTP